MNHPYHAYTLKRATSVFNPLASASKREISTLFERIATLFSSDICAILSTLRAISALARLCSLTDDAMSFTPLLECITASTFTLTASSYHTLASSDVFNVVVVRKPVNRIIHRLTSAVAWRIHSVFLYSRLQYWRPRSKYKRLVSALTLSFTIGSAFLGEAVHLPSMKLLSAGMSLS